MAATPPGPRASSIRTQGWHRALASKIASGRLGYDNNHFTFGGGLEFRMIKKLYMMLDYAFLDDVEDEGVSHVFSWQFLF